MPAENETSLRIDFHQGTVRIFGVSEEFVSKVLLHLPFVWDGREDCFRTDAMYADAIRTRLTKTLAGKFQWLAGRDAGSTDFDGLSISDRRSFKLRKDQVDAVAAFENGGGRGLVVMPTGT